MFFFTIIYIFSFISCIYCYFLNNYTVFREVFFTSEHFLQYKHHTVLVQAAIKNFVQNFWHPIIQKNNFKFFYFFCNKISSSCINLLNGWKWILINWFRKAKNHQTHILKKRNFHALHHHTHRFLVPVRRETIFNYNLTGN